MLSRFTSSIGFVGVDFGASAVRMLQIREQGDVLRVVGAGWFELAGDGPGQYNAPMLTERLRASFASGGFAGRRCVVSLPRGVVQMQSVRLPRMPDAELRQAAAWEASQRFGLDRAQMQVDFLRTSAPAKSGENREEVLLVAVPNAAISACLEPVMSAGLRPVAVDTDFGALARAFSRRYRREADREVVRAVLDIGGAASTLIILRGDQIAFCKQISIGQVHFDQAVAEHLQMDRSAATELRAARLVAAGAQPAPESASGATDPATDRAIFEAMRPIMGDLTKEVTLCLRYYGVTFRGGAPERLVLSGGGMEPRLEESLTQAWKMPVALDDPPGMLSLVRDEVRALLHRDSGPASSWATAVGLSLRGIYKQRQTRRSGDPEPVAAPTPTPEPVAPGARAAA